MKILRKLNCKRAFSTLLCLILTVTMIVGSIPVAKALEPIRLAENEIDEIVAESGAIYLATTNASLSEKEGAPYYLRVARGGSDLPAATLKLEMIDVSAKFGQDYTIEVLNEKAEILNADKAISIMEALSGDDVEQAMYDDYGNDLSMTDEAAKYLFEQNSQELSEVTSDAWDEYVRAKAAEDGIDLDAFYTNTEEETEELPQSDLSIAFEEQTGLIDDRTPISVSSDSSELGDIIQSGYGLDALNDLAEAVDAPAIVLEFAEGETEKIIVINTVNNDVGEGDKMTMAKLVGVSDDAFVADVYSVLNLTIEDDEEWARPTVSFAQDTFEPEGGYAKVTIKREGLSTMISSVHMTSVDGTAVGGSDYSQVDTEISFPYGVNERMVKIPVASTNLENGGEFKLVLSNPADCEVGDGEATVVIPKDAESYNPKDLAAVGAEASVGDRMDAPKLDLSKTSYLAAYGYYSRGSAYLEGETVVLRADSSDGLSTSPYCIAEAEWQISNPYSYSGFRVKWSKDGTVTSYGDNKILFYSKYQGTDTKVKNSTKNFDTKEIDLFADYARTDEITISCSHEGGKYAHSAVMKVYSITPIYRPFEIKLEQADTSALQFVDETGKLVPYDTLGEFVHAGETVLDSGKVAWATTGKDEITVSMNDTQYSYIKHLEIVKYAADGKTITGARRVVSNLPQGTTTASVKLTDWLVTDLSQGGFITYEKNAAMGLKGKVGIRAVLEPYPADFKVNNDDKRAKVTLIEPSNKTKDWVWHKGDYMFAQTTVNKGYERLWLPVGVEARYKVTGNSMLTTDIWENDLEKTYAGRKLEFTQLEIRPALEEYNNKLIVKVKESNLRYYDRSKGIFQSAKQVTKEEAGITGDETGYRYYLIVDTDTIMPNRYYEISAKPTAATSVAGWKQDVGQTAYYENSHFFRATIKRAENVIELLAPKRSDTTLTLNGTAYYSGATLDNRVEGEAWVPAEGAIVCVDSVHYATADMDGKFSVTTNSGTDEDGNAYNYPLYAVSGEAFTYKIVASGNTDYYRGKVEGTKNSDGITVDAGKLKVSAIDKSVPYIASVVAIDPDGVETNKIPMLDLGISKVRVTIKNCGAVYSDGQSDNLKENTKEVEVLAYHPKNAQPLLLAKASKDGYKATSEEEEDIPAYKPKVDGDTETWELSFSPHAADGFNSGDKIYIRVTTDRHEYKAYDENGNEVKDTAFNTTTYPPLDTGDVLIQPAVVVPDKYDIEILNDKEFMSDHIKFPILGSFNAVFNASGIIFSMKPLPNNGMRVSCGFMPEKWTKHSELDDGKGDTGEDYSVMALKESVKKAFQRGAVDKIRARNNGQSYANGKVIPLKSASAGVMFGIYLDFGRFCTLEGESLEIMGGGLFGGAMASFRLVLYLCVCAVPIYFGANIQFDAMVSLGVEKELRENDIPFVWDKVPVGFDADIVGHTNFEMYVGVGICGVIGARGGIAVDVNFEWWPTIARHYKKYNTMLKEHGFPEGLRPAGLQAKVYFKIWIDFLIKVAAFTYPLADGNIGYYKDIERLEKIEKDLKEKEKEKKNTALTGASDEPEQQGELVLTTQFKQPGDPSVWTGSTPDLLRSTFEQTDDFELKTGGYDHADPQLFDLGGGKELLVYVDEDSRIQGDDRTVLRYQVYDKNKDTWLNKPGVIQAKNGSTNVNGALEPRITYAGDKVMITWTALVLPDADHSDADYMQKYLKQRNVYAALVDAEALRSADADKPAQIDGTLVSETDKELYNTSPVGLYYENDGKEYLAVTYLASEVSVTDTSLSSDEQEIMMAMNSTNNSYVRTAQYDAKNSKWVTEFSVLKLNSTYDAKTKKWTPLSDSDDVMTDNNPTVIDLDNTVWEDWLIYTFVVDEDNDITTDEDREIFVKFQNLETGNATVNQLTDDGEYIDAEGETHVGTAKARTQLVSTLDSVYLFWQNGTDDVAWIDLGAILHEGYVDQSTGRITDEDKASRRFVSYPTVGVDIEPTYAGFQPLVDEEGNIYIVWQQGFSEDDIMKQELYAQSMVTFESTDEETGKTVTTTTWSDPIRLTYTEAKEGYGSVYNDEPAITALGDGELLVVCNRFGSSEDMTDVTALDLSMRGIHFNTVASVKPIEVVSSDLYPEAGEDLDFDVTVKNDGLKTANGYILFTLLIDKNKYDETKDYSEPLNLLVSEASLTAAILYPDHKLNPSEIETVHINKDTIKDNDVIFRIDEFGNLADSSFAAPDKLAENGYMLVTMAAEFVDGSDFINSEIYTNWPSKAFEDVIKVDPSYTVYANADTYRNATGSLGNESFIFNATVSADGNIPIRDTDRLVVGPSNFDNVDGFKSSAYYLDVPLSELEVSEEGEVRTITADLEIEPERFTYGFTQIYAEIVDKDDNTISEGIEMVIETPAPYAVTVKDKATKTAFSGDICLAPGDRLALDGSYEPSTHFRDGKVVYDVEDPNVATVDENGVITAVGEGSTKLYASVDIYDAVREYSVTVSADTYIVGDADDDGEVTIIDTTVIQRQLAQLPVPRFNAIAAEVDGDGEVTILDAAYIQRYDAHLRTPYDADINRRKVYADTEYLITE